VARNNWDIFNDWVHAVLLNGWPEEKPKCLAFIPYINKATDDFNHRAFGRAAKLPETATRQNTKCLDYLKVIQAELITMDHMVPKNDANSPPSNDNDKPATGSKKGELTSYERIDYERLKEEVLRMDEEIRDMKGALKRYGKMAEYLAEFGVLPR